MKQRRCKSLAAPYWGQIGISHKRENVCIARVQFSTKPYLFLLKGLRAAGNNPMQSIPMSSFSFWGVFGLL